MMVGLHSAKAPSLKTSPTHCWLRKWNASNLKDLTKPLKQLSGWQMIQECHHSDPCRGFYAVMSRILNRCNMKSLSLGSIFRSILDAFSWPFWKLWLSCSCIWPRHKMILMWNDESFTRGYQRFGYERTNIPWSLTTATSQQKGTSESSPIYCIKHIFRQNKVSLVIPVVEGGP